MSTQANTPISRDELLKALRDELLTLKEVLYITKLSRTKVWQLIKAGKLRRCPNTGRRVLVPGWSLTECFQLQSSK
jgi:predicted DNA-binding transcriptional regulator AlpA